MVANQTLAPPPIDLSSLCLELAEHAPLPMATVESASHLVRYVNPAFCRLMHKTREQLVGKPFAEIMPENDDCLTILNRVCITGISETYAAQQYSRPHRVFWSYTMWPILANGGAMAVIIQVTETAALHEQKVAINEALILSSVRQQELTEAAESSNARLKLEIVAHRKTSRDLAEKARLVDLSNDAIIVYDLNDKITLWNKGAEKLYHWTSQEAVGKQVLTLLPAEFPIPRERIIAQLRSEGQFSGEVVLMARDGTRVPSLCRWVLDRGAKSIMTSQTDITERKQFEQEREAHLVKERESRMEAEAANRSKDQFLATLSHEVRTPLNAILGWATILRGGKCDGAEFQEGMEVIERNCRAQARLIEDVLDISRIVSGKLRLQNHPCELAEAINAAIDVVRPAANAKGLRIEAFLDATASFCSCDANRMQQVVWNLLTNAVKFTPTGRRVRVTLTREGSEAKIQVIDEGLGMAPDFLPFAFDRFRQADSGTQRKFGGLGLGLSIVKHIVEMHGGTVHAYSAGEGLGATFTVNLPIHPAQTDEGVSQPAENSDKTPLAGPMPVRLEGLRVMVVDDEPDARRLLTKVLGEAGAIVTAVGSVAEALTALAAANPQVLVSDIAMPEQDGYDLIRQVRGIGLTAKELPAVALTAFAHKEDRLRALLAGFQVHVSKPIDPHDLTTVIASVAGRTE